MTFIYSGKVSFLLSASSLYSEHVTATARKDPAVCPCGMWNSWEMLWTVTKYHRRRLYLLKVSPKPRSGYNKQNQKSMSQEPLIFQLQFAEMSAANEMGSSQVGVFHILWWINCRFLPFPADRKIRPMGFIAKAHALDGCWLNIKKTPYIQLHLAQTWTLPHNRKKTTHKPEINDLEDDSTNVVLPTHGGGWIIPLTNHHTPAEFHIGQWVNYLEHEVPPLEFGHF